MNLLNETLDCLKVLESESKILFKDVKFVIGEDYSFSDNDYDDWYGSRYDYENLLDYKGEHII